MSSLNAASSLVMLLTSAEEGTPEHLGLMMSDIIHVFKIRDRGREWQVCRVADAVDEFGRQPAVHTVSQTDDVDKFVSPREQKASIRSNR